ncbi:MAG: hypothetical protein R2822_06775 [Spirosomataceae bacterium]
MPSYPFRLLFFFIFGSVTISYAQNRPKWRDRLNPDSLVNREVSLIPMPILQSSPETGVRAGLSMDYFFNSSKPTDSLPTRDSFAWLMATYSTRKQLMIEPIWQIYTNKEKYLLRGQAGYIDFSEYFWGIGNEVLPASSPPSIFYSRTYFQGEFLRQLIPNIFGGIQVQANITKNLTFDNSLNQLLDGVLGSSGSSTVGIGPNIIFDFRDNPFSPIKGGFLELSYTAHHSELRSEYTYQETLVDARKYFSFKNTQFLGFQVVGNFTNGDVPLRELPRLGGSNIMRGMVQGRYRDKNTVALQAEYRKGLNRF